MNTRSSVFFVLCILAMLSCAAALFYVGQVALDGTATSQYLARIFIVLTVLFAGSAMLTWGKNPNRVYNPKITLVRNGGSILCVYLSALAFHLPGFWGPGVGWLTVLITVIILDIIWKKEAAADDEFIQLSRPHGGPSKFFSLLILTAMVSFATVVSYLAAWVTTASLHPVMWGFVGLLVLSAVTSTRILIKRPASVYKPKINLERNGSSILGVAFTAIAFQLSAPLGVMLGVISILITVVILFKIWRTEAASEIAERKRIEAVQASPPVVKTAYAPAADSTSPDKTGKSS